MSAPSSPYRERGWTVRKLKEELKQRKLPSWGTKETLIDRLEEWTVQDKTPSKREPNEGARDAYIGMKFTELRTECKSNNLLTTGTKQELIERLVSASASPLKLSKSPQRSDKSPTRRSPRVALDKRSDLLAAIEGSNLLVSKGIGSQHAELSWAKSPLQILKFFALFLVDQIKALCAYAHHHQGKTAAFIGLISFLFGLHLWDPSFFGKYEEIFLWYGRWFILGILSSIGLGTGAHTFLLFLGPFIAQVTTAAYECSSLDFALFGANSLHCVNASKTLVTFWNLVLKVKWEAFLWGAGTAFGELPPYFIARASALAGKKSGELLELEQIKKKPAKKRTLSDKAHLVMLYIVQSLGFFGILLCASVPNPLFDLAGLTCGYFHVPFLTFFAATFIGKSLVKSFIQTAFVILLFSKSTVESILALLHGTAPLLHGRVSEWLNQQKHTFSTKVAPSDDVNFVGLAWNCFLFLMIGYFVLSIVKSLAVIQKNKRKTSY